MIIKQSRKLKNGFTRSGSVHSPLALLLEARIQQHLAKISNNLCYIIQFTFYSDNFTRSVAEIRARRTLNWFWNSNWIYRKKSKRFVWNSTIELLSSLHKYFSSFLILSSVSVSFEGELLGYLNSFACFCFLLLMQIVYVLKKGQITNKECSSRRRVPPVCIS